MQIIRLPSLPGAPALPPLLRPDLNSDRHPSWRNSSWWPVSWISLSFFFFFLYNFYLFFDFILDIFFLGCCWSAKNPILNTNTGRWIELGDRQKSRIEENYFSTRIFLSLIFHSKNRSLLNFLIHFSQRNQSRLEIFLKKWYNTWYQLLLLSPGL